MLLVSCILCCSLLLWSILVLSMGRTLHDKYTFGVQVRLSNEDTHSIIEFILHYIEEGADFFFIYVDSPSVDISSVLKCIPDHLYELYDHRTLTQNNEGMDSLSVHEILFSVAAVADKVHWVLIADVDTLVTSRATPDLSIREVLTGKWADCAILAVPSIFYSWGSLVHTPRNAARYVLTHRWGYDERYSRNVSEGSIFHNRHTGTDNYMILRTRDFPSLRKWNFTHGSVQGYHNSHGGCNGMGGPVCIPRVSGPMACATEIPMNIVKSYASKCQYPNDNGGFYSNFLRKQGELPKWCPFSNKFIAQQAPNSTLLVEADVDHMQLIAFSYRVKSLQDWARKRLGLQGIYGEANRVDVFDDFMLSVRRPAREAHPDFIKAAEVSRSCPARLFDRHVQPQPAEPIGWAAAWQRKVLEQPGELAPLEELLQEEDVTKYEFFFSVMIFCRDELEVLLEQVKHYLEEGADHIFIFDDDSSDATRSVLGSCVDAAHVTVYDRTHFDSAQRLSQHEAYSRMYNEMGLRHRTRWLAVVDADEFISSRSQPHATVRELLNSSSLSSCDIISVPWILYAWGDVQHTPSNNLRYTLNYRAGYDQRFSKGVEGETKFRERWDGENNKVIFRTRRVADYRETHSARLADHEQGGLLCVPHTAPQLECAAQTARTSGLNTSAFHNIVHKSARNFLDQYNSSQGLPQFCPFSNRYRGMNSLWRTFIMEEDVPQLELACFHYRVKSQDDWARKSAGGRFNAWEYKGQTESAANRADIHDDFMSSVRRPAREAHPDFLRAEELMSSCPF